MNVIMIIRFCILYTHFFYYILSFSAVFSHFCNPNTNVDDKHNAADQKDNPQSCQLKINRVVQFVKFICGGAIVHGAVVHGDEEDGELSDVADVGPVVVVGLPKGQVDQVVNDEVNAQQKDDQSREHVLVHARHVKANLHPVKNGHHEIGSLHAADLELVFVLTKAFLLSALKDKNHQQRNENGAYSSQSTVNVKRVSSVSVLEVKASAVGEVEAVEKNESEKNFFEEAATEAVEIGTALAEGQKIEDESNNHDQSHQNEHQIAVAEEVRSVADCLNSRRSAGRGLKSTRVCGFLVVEFEVESVG